jgi:hypothetical protein
VMEFLLGRGAVRLAKADYVSAHVGFLLGRPSSERIWGRGHGLGLQSSGHRPQDQATSCKPPELPGASAVLRVASTGIVRVEASEPTPRRASRATAEGRWLKADN